MENYSHPQIPEILKQEGNTTCVDCGSEKPNWASLNNGVFLCLKCAGIHRGFGMSVSLIRSLQIDSWTEKQLLYLKKGGNNNFRNNLSEFNIAETATLDIKYKSKAADYYRKYLRNEVEKESDPNYAPIQIDKPDMEVAMDLLEIKGDGEEENLNPKKEENKKVFKNKFFGFMNNVFNKVKEGTNNAAKKVGKGFTDLKIKDKLKVAGNAIAGAAKTSSHFIVENSKKAVNKTKEGMKNLSQKTKSAFTKKGHKDSNEATNQTEEKKEENKEDVKEGEKKEEEKKEEEKKDETKEEVKEEKKEEEKKEEEKKEEIKEEKKEEEKKEEVKKEKKEEEKKEEIKEEKKEEEKKEEVKEEKKEEEKKEEVKEEKKEEEKKEEVKKDDVPEEKKETTEEKKDENTTTA